MKNRLKSALILAAVAGITLTSCNGNKKADDTTGTDTTQMEEGGTIGGGDQGTGTETDTLDSGTDTTGSTDTTGAGK